MESDYVKMSPKGQLVVPQEIRIDEGFAPGDRFVPFPVKGGILFKNEPKRTISSTTRY